jgi:hypothetical protein
MCIGRGARDVGVKRYNLEKKAFGTNKRYIFSLAMADPQMLTAEGEDYLKEEINKRIGGLWFYVCSSYPCRHGH